MCGGGRVDLQHVEYAAARVDAEHPLLPGPLERRAQLHDGDAHLDVRAARAAHSGAGPRRAGFARDLGAVLHRRPVQVGHSVSVVAGGQQCDRDGGGGGIATAPATVSTATTVASDHSHECEHVLGRWRWWFRG